MTAASQADEGEVPWCHQAVEEEIMDLVLQRVEGDLPLKEDPSSNLCTTLSNTLNMARIRCKLDLDYHCNCIKIY